MSLCYKHSIIVATIMCAKITDKITNDTLIKTPRDPDLLVAFNEDMKLTLPLWIKCRAKRRYVGPRVLKIAAHSLQCNASRRRGCAAQRHDVLPWEK